MRDTEVKKEIYYRMPTSPKSLQPNHSIKNRTLWAPMPKHLPLLNLMQKLNSGSQERMILFLDYLASFLKILLVRFSDLGKLNELQVKPSRKRKRKAASRVRGGGLNRAFLMLLLLSGVLLALDSLINT
jgi:hypothetical protein